jgi:hypothetical protein
MKRFWVLVLLPLLAGQPAWAQQANPAQEAIPPTPGQQQGPSTGPGVSRQRTEDIDRRTGVNPQQARRMNQEVDQTYKFLMQKSQSDPLAPSGTTGQKPVGR